MQHAARVHMIIHHDSVKYPHVLQASLLSFMLDERVRLAFDAALGVADSLRKVRLLLCCFPDRRLPRVFLL